MGVSFHYKGEGESLKWGLYFNRISWLKLTRENIEPHII
jgi:hypothetical protein